jgi:asparagine synthase (glutamine-hydrolysing)
MRRVDPSELGQGVLWALRASLAMETEPLLDTLRLRFAVETLDHQRELHVVLSGYLPDDLLVKLDRACMAASLEGRAPFLDHHLVEFACRLPIDLKIRGVVTKRVLRRAVADLVPPSIRRRVKRGLSVPLASWLAGPLYGFTRDTLEALDPHLVRPEAVRALLREHVDRRRDNRRELWALIVLQLWLEAWGSR